jgi:hypothetical protein
MESAKGNAVLPAMDSLVNDTSLVHNNILLHEDFVTDFKKKQDYSYAFNLDSLLQKKQEQAGFREEMKNGNHSIIENFFNAAATKVFFGVIAALFVLFILYKLLFIKGFFQNQAITDKVTVLNERELPVDEADYILLIQAAINKKDYRFAVRYLFLRTLQGLILSGKVVYAPGKTNAQYIRELVSISTKQEFVNLVNIYDYTWYGNFKIEEKHFLDIWRRFDLFNSNMPAR